MIWVFIIGSNIIAVAIALFFIFKYKKKWHGIKHYEKIRDEVTVRKEEPEEDYDDEDEEFSSIGSLIGSFVGLIILINVAFGVLDAVTETTATMNVTETSTAVFNVIPLFIGIAIMVAGILLVFKTLQRLGLV